MDFYAPRSLGQTGLKVGALGIASGYGVPTSAIEQAFERGCNYFYWGSRRTDDMARAIRNLCDKGKREDLVLLIQSYSRSSLLLQSFFEKGLKRLKLDYVDILLLGWHNQLPSKRIIDCALYLKEQGKVRFLAVSSHKRSAFSLFMEQGLFDICHFRYNAAHRGAETDLLPILSGDFKPGRVAYTATRWGQLLKPQKMPEGELPLTASDCYRFVLTHPDVDVCMCGPRNEHEMNHALQILQLGPLDEPELKRIQRIGDYVYKNSRMFF